MFYASCFINSVNEFSMTKSQFPIKSKNINPKERLEGVTVCPPGTLRAALRAGGFVGHWALGFGVFLSLLAAPLVALAVLPEYIPITKLPEPPTGLIGTGLSGYLQNIFWLAIVFAGVLAVLVITWGGVLYMTTDAFGRKSEAKNRITAAIGGFILAVSSVLILQIINPELLEFKLLVDPQTFTVPDLSSARSGGCTEYAPADIVQCAWTNTTATCRDEFFPGWQTIATEACVPRTGSGPNCCGATAAVAAGTLPAQGNQNWYYCYKPAGAASQTNIAFYPNDVDQEQAEALANCGYAVAGFDARAVGGCFQVPNVAHATVNANPAVYCGSYAPE